MKTSLKNIKFFLLIFLMAIASGMQIIAKEKPNIVLFYIDDWAWNGSPVPMNDDMRNSFMPILQMPNVDKLAAAGMKFTNAYGSPQCSPARACIQTGQLENTLIILFGDHGYHLGEHNWWNKVTIFEKGTNAPFIMAGQSVGKKGIKSEAMFVYVDIYPTLADLFQLKNTPDYLEGKSFAGVVNDPSTSFRKEVRAIINRGNMLGRMVKNGEWRYVEWDNGNKGNELYDQKADPVEYNNLANNPAYSNVVAEMKKILLEK